MPKWKNENINVLIPMAGNGSRFNNSGFNTIKPLININGKLMVELVIEKLNIDANFIFVVKEEHYIKYNLQNQLSKITTSNTIVQSTGIQQGTTHSILFAKHLINNNNPLLIANADQIWDWNSLGFYNHISQTDIDGCIVTFVEENRNPKFSFAKVNNQGLVVEVAEKKPISNLGTAGIYFYQKGSDFVKYAEQMINKNIRVNNEFYLAPVYNEYISDNKKITTFNCKKLIELGTPESLNSYLNAIHNLET